MNNQDYNNKQNTDSRKQIVQGEYNLIQMNKTVLNIFAEGLKKLLYLSNENGALWQKNNQRTKKGTYILNMFPKNRKTENKSERKLKL